MKTELPHNPFVAGDWIRWLINGHFREGQVLESEGDSIVVRWLDGETQVFPVVEGYVYPYGEGMEVIPKPKKAHQLARQAEKGVMTVPRAASFLGVEPKRVRALLRAGRLSGEQRDGKWVSVSESSLRDLRDG